VVAAAGLVVVVAATRATAPPDRVDAGRPGSVRGLATGVALDLPWAAGNLVHLDARTVTMPEGWRVDRVVRAAGGVLVDAVKGQTQAISFVPRRGAVRILAQGRDGELYGLGADPTGDIAAWSTYETPRRSRLVAMRVATGEVVAELPLDALAFVVAWDRRGPILNYAVDPGGSPVSVDLDSGRVAEVGTGNSNSGAPTFAAYSPATRTMAMTTADGCLVTYDVASMKKIQRRCIGVTGPAAFSPTGELLAVTDLARKAVAVIAATGRVVDRNSLPEGTKAVRQIVWESREARVMVVTDGRRERGVALRRDRSLRASPRLRAR